MQDLKKIETAVLRSMVAAHASYYGRILTVQEATDCKNTICLLQDEIISRLVPNEKLKIPLIINQPSTMLPWSHK